MVLVAVLVSGCTAAADQDDGDGNGDSDSDSDSDAGGALPPPTITGKADGTGIPWTAVGRGVAYQRVSAGNAILIAYGGYSAHLSYSAGWASELIDAKLGALGVGQVYAVQGPQDPGYDARELANTKLRAHLATIDDGTSPIYVVAHSSGSYVAHELLAQLHAVANAGVLGRIGYANLDGGGTGLTSYIVEGLRAMTFVYADDPELASGFSENHSTAVALGAAYAAAATTFEVVVPSTGCNNGAGWCLHDVLVTHRPHDRATYDLADDYTDFVNRPPTVEYLDSLAPDDDGSGSSGSDT